MIIKAKPAKTVIQTCSVLFLEGDSFLVIYPPKDLTGSKCSYLIISPVGLFPPFLT
jgi:hypothetical protein